MTNLPLEVLKLMEMANGHQEIFLTESVSWQAFDVYAERVIRELDGEVTDKANSAVERVWDALIDRRKFWIAYGDYPLFDVSLGPCDDDAATKIPEILTRLLEIKGR